MKTIEDILFEMGYRTSRFGIGDRVFTNGGGLIDDKGKLHKPLVSGEIVSIEYFKCRRTYRIRWIYAKLDVVFAYTEEELKNLIEKMGWKVIADG